MLTSSVFSSPKRGKWGKSSYRGNCTGYIIKDLLEYFKPTKFIETYGGSGTGFDLAQDLGMKGSIHLDLNPDFGQKFQHESQIKSGKYGDFNLLRNEIPTGDFIFSHPPYHDIIHYSGDQWGIKGHSHPDDLSRCGSYEEFIKKLDFINAKIYSALKNGGRHAILIGDVRKDGKYYSIIKDMSYYGQLESHILKIQHNCVSDNVNYSGRFIKIAHEHLLIFRKGQVWQIPITAVKKAFGDIRESKLPTWRDLVQAALEDLGGVATLKQLYSALRNTEKVKSNENWEAKIRQTLQCYNEFQSISRGLWGFSLNLTAA